MKYRAEIDGLRTIAVLPVLFFHLSLDFFSGGYTGVDIFFVISGYLITNIIINEIDQGKFSFASFYRRRALRILPPLALVLVATFIAAWLFMLPAEVEELGRSSIATSLFASNIYFFKAYNYFSVLAESNPLLHTWSLSVEEQFYIFTPLFLWACCFFKPIQKYRSHIFVLGILISFVCSIWMLQWSPEAAFYLLPSRFWELGIGSLIALYSLDKKVDAKYTNVMGAIGFCLIGYSIFFLDEHDIFPGWNAIYPVFGAAFLILAGGQSISGRFLSMAPVVWIGKISYSLYLWHWPILIFYKLIFLKTELSGFDAIILTITSFAIAYLSYLYWEQPFRKLKAISTLKVLSTTFAGLVAVTAVGMGLLAIDGKWRAYPEKVQSYTDFTLNYSKSEKYNKQFIPRGKKCFVTSSSANGAEAFDTDNCLEQSKNNPPIIILGDSHSAHFAGPLTSVFSEYDVLPIHASGCLPLWPLEGEMRCTNLIEKSLEEYIPALENSIVFLSARWTKAGKQIPSDFEQRLTGMIQNLYSAGAEKVIVLGPNREFKTNLPLLLARFELVNRSDLDSFENTRVPDYDKKIKQVITKLNDNTKYISLLNNICNSDSCDMSKPFLFDDNHLTYETALEVVKGIKLEAGL